MQTLSAKPRIGINADYRNRKDPVPAYSYLAAGYYDAIMAAGGIPVVLPPLKDVGDLRSIVDMFDGFVMIGGQDLDPRRDGFMLHPTVRPMEPRREVFDRALIDVLYEQRIPVFGIGSGMQLLNLSRGGNLFLHVPEDVPTAIPHKDPQDPGHRHGLDIEPESLMERVFGDGEIRVNSAHHMAIDELAQGFRVTARCPDGIIEAIESTQDDWFALGTQFHPEAESASALDIRIFEEFILGITQPATYAAPVAA